MWKYDDGINVLIFNLVTGSLHPFPSILDAALRKSLQQPFICGAKAKSNQVKKISRMSVYMQYVERSALNKKRWNNFFKCVKYSDLYAVAKSRDWRRVDMDRPQRRRATVACREFAILNHDKKTVLRQARSQLRGWNCSLVCALPILCSPLSLFSRPFVCGSHWAHFVRKTHTKSGHSNWQL